MGGPTGVLISEITCSVFQLYLYCVHTYFVRVAAVGSKTKKYAIWNAACLFPYEWKGRNAVPEVLSAGTSEAMNRSFHTIRLIGMHYIFMQN